MQEGRFLFLALFLAVWLIPRTGVTAAEERVVYDSSKGLVGFHVYNEPLNFVLSEVAFKTGVKIYMDPTIARTVTLEIQNIPLEKGLKRLIQPYSDAMVFKQVKDPNGKPVQRLEQVKVFKPGYPEQANLLLKPFARKPSARAELEQRRIERERQERQELKERAAAGDGVAAESLKDLEARDKRRLEIAQEKERRKMQEEQHIAEVRKRTMEMGQQRIQSAVGQQAPSTGLNQ